MVIVHRVSRISIKFNQHQEHEASGGHEVMVDDKGAITRRTLFTPTQYIADESLTGITYLVINEGGERKEVEQVCEESPDIGVAVFSETFVVKAINLRDLSRLVVSAKNGYPIAIAQLQSHQQGYCLH
jgi:hypothetical protein